MGCNSNYKLTVNTPAKGEEDFDFMDNFEKDLREISRMFPNSLFKVKESGVYETPFEYHYYAKDGKMTMLEPVLVWPEFKMEDLK